MRKRMGKQRYLGNKRGSQQTLKEAGAQEGTPAATVASKQANNLSA